MSKDAHSKEGQTKEIHKDGHKEGHKDAAPGAEHKKPEHKKPDAPAAKSKGHNALPGGCHSWGCKAHATRFNFCDEHYDHFKFGLIKKTGEPVPDYEKKFEHYMSHKNKGKKSAQKVA